MSSEIKKAASILASGGLVAFPTETVYGLGADARNSDAVAQIFKVKGRPSNNPLIVHVASIEELLKYCDLSRSWNERLTRARLARLSALWPGPLSVVLPKSAEIALNVCAGGDSVGLRVPRHPLALELLRAFGGPVAAPSANLSMYVSPTTAAHVREGLGDAVSCVLDGGPCEVGLESTVLSLLEETPKLLRPGGVTAETIEALLETLVERPIKSSHDDKKLLLSPGMMAKHYSPRAKVILKTELATYPNLPARVGALVFSDWKPPFTPTITKVISSSGSFAEIATKLFAALRELDAAGLDAIVVDTCEPQGLGEAIMDRIVRASA
jgi:L-threonylcarbamoyladenylate synthase